MRDLRDRYASADLPILVSGCVGPRGDGYVPATVRNADAALSYHSAQVSVLAEAGADLITALTMTHAEEAIGIVRAARQSSVPVVVSFTVETDGRLPSGEALSAVIAEVDAATDGSPSYYMINCAHPTHFQQALTPGAEWTLRVRGLRANASKRSHQELDQAAELDAGDPIELGGQYRDLLKAHPQLTVLGGCCGTDHRHIESIAHACRTLV
jgi:S-methylmethionine-dependent homocysteine/selenocysteine methylase